MFLGYTGDSFVVGLSVGGLLFGHHIIPVLLHIHVDDVTMPSEIPQSCDGRRMLHDAKWQELERDRWLIG